MNCPCCSLLPYEVCCGPLHEGVATASTAHALMRSRFSAFALHKAQYIHDTYVAEERADHPVEAIIKNLRNRSWTKLEITKISSIDSTHARVCFSAFFQVGEREFILKEDSAFRKDDGCWLYWGAKSTQIS